MTARQYDATDCAGRNDRIAGMYARGMTYAAISREFGISASRTRQIVKSIERTTERRRRMHSEPLTSVSVRTANALRAFYGEVTDASILKAADETDQLLRAGIGFGKLCAREVMERAAIARAKAEHQP